LKGHLAVYNKKTDDKKTGDKKLRNQISNHKSKGEKRALDDKRSEVPGGQNGKGGGKRL